MNPLPADAKPCPLYYTVNAEGMKPERFESQEQAIERAMELIRGDRSREYLVMTVMPYGVDPMRTIRFNPTKSVRVIADRTVSLKES